MSLSQEWSVSRWRSLELSSPSGFKQSLSGGSLPSHLFVQSEQVFWLIGALRPMSATRTPSARCFETNGLDAPENRDAMAGEEASASEKRPSLRFGCKIGKRVSASLAPSHRPSHKLMKLMEFMVWALSSGLARRSCASNTVNGTLPQMVRNP